MKRTSAPRRAATTGGMAARAAGAAAALAVGAVLVAGSPASAAAPTTSVRPFTLAPPVVPTTLTVGTSTDVTGRIKHWRKTAGLRIRLQLRGSSDATPPTHTAWSVVDNEQAKHSAFSLSYTPTSATDAQLRLQLTRGGKVIATSRVVNVEAHRDPTAPVKTPCTAAATPPIPSGQGALIGGVYNVGGPAPGVHQCNGQAQTLTITSSDTAQVVATLPVAASQEYVTTLAPGHYTLSTGYCTGTATVTAGMVTRADTVCNIP